MTKHRVSSNTRDTLATILILWVIVAAGVALASGYALGVPPWNNPDEPAHFNYVRHIATTGQLPQLEPGDWDAQLLDRLKTAKFPPSEPVDSIAYESHQPPLYYLLASPILAATSRFPLQEQVGALRLFSVVLSGLTVLLAFSGVRTLFPQERPLQLGVAGFVAFLPMRSAVAGSISNDALAECVATLLILTMLWVTNRGFGRRQAILLGLLMGAALLTKMTLYLLLPLALAAALFAPQGKGGKNTGVSSRLKLVGLALAIALAIAGWWFVRNGMLYGPTDIFGWQRHDQVVVGQPRFEMLDGAALSYLATTLFKSFWGQFGWMGILIDERLYFVLMLVSGLAAFGLVLFSSRVVFSKGFLSHQQKASLALMGLALLAVVGQVGLYNLSFIQAQGRYLYPALLPIALFFVLGLRELIAPVHTRLLLTLSVASLALLDYVCLARYVLPYFR